MSGLPTGRSLVRGGHHREAVGPVIVVDRVVGVDGVPGDAGRAGVNGWSWWKRLSRGCRRADA